MSEKKSEIEVLGCSVRFNEESDEPVFHSTLVKIKGNIRKMLGYKVQAEKNISYTVDLDGVRVCDALEPFGSSLRIKVATIRDLDNFVEVADKLNGTVIAYGDIDDLIGKEGKGRQPMLVKWLVSTGKFDAEAARAVYDDPIRRAKAQAMFDKLMQKVDVSDILADADEADNEEPVRHDG